MTTAATAPPALEATAEEKEGEKHRPGVFADNAIDAFEKYFDDIIPDPVRILGLRLLPLSLGRYRMMKRFDVAFVSEAQAEATVADLVLGVLICSMPVAEFEAFAVSSDFSSQIRRWAIGIGAMPPWWLRPDSRFRLLRFLAACLNGSFFGRRWRRTHSFDVIEKITAFNRYIQEGSEAPPYWDESNSDRVSGAHWSQSVEVILRGNLGWSEEEVNERPLNKALWDYFKHMENQGLVRIMTDLERKELETPLAPEKSKAISDWMKMIRQAQNPGGHHGQ